MIRKICIIAIVLILISGCAKEGEINDSAFTAQEELELIAETFARYWEQKNFDAMYDMFLPELKEKRSKNDFIIFFSAKETFDTVVMRLDKISIVSEKEAYAYFTISSSVYDVKAPAMQLLKQNGEWYINGLLPIFEDDCADICVPLCKCQTFECSPDTGFTCKYNLKEDCNCMTDSDCPNNLVCLESRCDRIQCTQNKQCENQATEEFIYQCKAQGFQRWVHSYCKHGKCNFNCYEQENMAEPPENTIKVDAVVFDEYVEIRNYDRDLTRVSVVFNEELRINIDEINVGTTAKVTKPKNLEVKSVYVYSEQGQYLWFTGKLSKI